MKVQSVTLIILIILAGFYPLRAQENENSENPTEVQEVKEVKVDRKPVRSPFENGILIDLSLTRQDLAEMTGTTLYTVSRILSQWEKDGLVHSQREQVTILSPHRLVMIAEEMGK